MVLAQALTLFPGQKMVPELSADQKMHWSFVLMHHSPAREEAVLKQRKAAMPSSKFLTMNQPLHSAWSQSQLTEMFHYSRHTEGLIIFLKLHVIIQDTALCVIWQPLLSVFRWSTSVSHSEISEFHLRLDTSLTHDIGTPFCLRLRSLNFVFSSLPWVFLITEVITKYLLYDFDWHSTVIRTLCPVPFKKRVRQNK